MSEPAFLLVKNNKSIQTRKWMNFSKDYTGTEIIFRIKLNLWI